MINTAIIGCGMSARPFHLPLIAANPAYRLTALVSSKEQPGIPVPRYPDAATMLAESDAELVIITAPNSVHYDLAAECLAAGRHVVLEKPMVNTFAEGQVLIRLAAENRRLLSVFHNRRWDSDYLTLKQLLADGVLGAPRILISRWDRYRPQVRDRWRENPGAGAGVWYDLGAHLLDQVLDLFGLPQAVTGHCRALRPGSQTVDYAHVQLHYVTHEVVLHTSPYCNAPVARFHFEGECATYVKYGLDPQEAQLKAGMHPDDPAYGVEPAEQHGTLYTENSSRCIATLRGNFSAYYANIAAAIRGEAPLTVTAEQALHVIYLTELAQQSSDEGRRLPVALPA
jgi:oxidoreductase, NAD-binding